MKELFMAAAALTIAVATAPSPSQAAPKTSPKSQYCELAKSQRNVPSWNEYYGCLKAPGRQAFAQAPTPTQAAAPAQQTGAKIEYCELAKNQRNTPSWNEYYGCLRR